MKEKIKKLYLDLNGFVKTKDFAKYGFSVAHKYNGWLKDIDLLIKKCDNKKDKEMLGNVRLIAVYYSLGINANLIAELSLLVEKYYES